MLWNSYWTKADPTSFPVNNALCFTDDTITNYTASEREQHEDVVSYFLDTPILRISFLRPPSSTPLFKLFPHPRLKHEGYTLRYRKIQKHHYLISSYALVMKSTQNHPTIPKPLLTCKYAYLNVSHKLPKVQWPLDKTKSPFINQLLCSTLCLSTHILVSAPARFGVCSQQPQGAPVQLYILHNTRPLTSRQLKDSSFLPHMHHF